MTDPMTPERLQFFRDWVDGKWPDGSPHVPADTESWTRELVAEVDRLKLLVVTEREQHGLYRGRYESAKAEVGRLRAELRCQQLRARSAEAIAGIVDRGGKR